MNKIKALYTNEIIKILHRPSVFIVAVFALVLAFAFPFLLRLVYIGDYSEVFEIYTKEKFEEDLAGYKTELKNANLKTTKETVEIEVKGQAKSYEMTLYTGNDIPRILSFTNCYEDIISKYDFEKYPMRQTWISLDALSRYRSAEQELINMQTVPFEERDAEWLSTFEKETTSRDYFRRSLFEHDYEYYCKGLETNAVANDYNDPRFTPGIIRQVAASDPKGELGYMEVNYLMQYLVEKNENRELLDSGLERSGTLPRILTEERKNILANSNKILDYKFEKRNTFSEESAICITVNHYTSQVAQYGIIVLLILIAGSSVSQELATGSIKSLIIAPVKRWKIYTAKLLSVITFMLLASVLVSIIAIIGTGIAFGFDKLPPYLYVSGGAVKEMPYFSARILIDLVQNISVFFYAFVAFMISCFTKNTGVSVGVSVGLLLCHQVPALIGMSEMPPRILDFTPLANMDIVNKVFPYIKLMVYDAESISMFISDGFNLPLWHCIVYTAVLTFTVLFIAYEQFTRKDIQ
ncbi:MAG: ABC transporter permease [Saccharofermentans sp.]|nr:ABC transporter permease [Saccharofermentans sp.]